MVFSFASESIAADCGFRVRHSSHNFCANFYVRFNVISGAVVSLIPSSKHGENMIWRKFVVLPLILLAAPAVAQSAPQMNKADAPASVRNTAYDTTSVQQFLSVCSRDTSGCSIEISAALLDKLDAPNATSVCMTDGHYEKPVVAWLKDHAESWSMPTEDGIYTAFKTLYPCT